MRHTLNQMTAPVRLQGRIGFCCVVIGSIAALCLLWPPFGHAASTGRAIDHFTVTPGKTGTRKVGNSFTVMIVAVDARGVRVSHFNGPDGTWSDALGQISTPSPAPFENGISVTTVHFASPVHQDTIRFTSGSLSGVSHGFDVMGPLDTVLVKVAGPVHPGVPFIVRASARDSAGNILPNFVDASPTWTVSGGTITPLAPVAFTRGWSMTTKAVIPSAITGIRITVTTHGQSYSSGPFSVAT